MEKKAGRIEFIELFRILLPAKWNCITGLIFFSGHGAGLVWRAGKRIILTDRVGLQGKARCRRYTWITSSRRMRLGSRR